MCSLVDMRHCDKNAGPTVVCAWLLRQSVVSRGKPAITCTTKCPLKEVEKEDEEEEKEVEQEQEEEEEGEEEEGLFGSRRKIYET